LNKIELFAFDLDGTLLDTAPDFYKSVNILRQKYDLDTADYDQVRTRVSQGAASLAAYALGLDKDAEEVIEFHRQELLEIYEGCCMDETIPFEGIDKVLDQLNDMEIKWGIITNKPRRFAESIVDNKLNIYKTPFLICPDDVGVRKPEPDGLLHALKISNSSPKNSIYIGDHAIDIEAGKRAKMITGAAAYGYIPLEDSVVNWEAHHIFQNPMAITSLI
jgi:phosphoglycolate phosphatase